MNSQMTDFAFAGKCGFFGASGLTPAAVDAALALEPSRQESANKVAKPITPAPEPVRRRKSRREKKDESGWAKRCGSFISVDVEEFIEAKENLAKIGEGELGVPGLAGFGIGVTLLFDERPGDFRFILRR